METPLVSFVIPVFNSETYITRCLQAICQIRFPAVAWEVVLMDNGSTDRTPQLMTELGFTFHVLPDVNVSTLRNRGASLSQGQFIAFVDSDVEVTPQWLQAGLPAFADPQVVASGCFPEVPPQATWVQQTWDIHQRGRQPQQALTAVPWLPSMNLLVRRETFLTVAGFNEHLETAEDVDLCYRLGNYGCILNNPAMAAVHWGEARDLRTFWRKEVWRGLGNLPGIGSHGWRWDELPSLGYPLYMLCLVGLAGLAVYRDLTQQRLFWLPLSLALLLLPAFLLALRTAYVARRLRALPRLWCLYGVYGLARAYAILKHFIT